MEELRTPLRRLTPDGEPIPEKASEAEQALAGVEDSPMEAAEDDEFDDAREERRKDMPERVEDASGVLRLALMEERMRRIVEGRKMAPSFFEMRLQQLTRQLAEEKTRFLQALAQEEAATIAEIKMTRDFLAEKHGIDLSLYGYDEATGALTLLP